MLARKPDASLGQKIKAAPEDQLRSQVGRRHRIDVDDQLGFALAIEPMHPVGLKDRDLMTLPGAGGVEVRLEQVRWETQSSGSANHVAGSAVTRREEASGADEADGTDEETDPLRRVPDRCGELDEGRWHVECSSALGCVQRRRLVASLALDGVENAWSRHRPLPLRRFDQARDKQVIVA